MIRKKTGRGSTFWRFLISKRWWIWASRSILFESHWRAEVWWFGNLQQSTARSVSTKQICDLLKRETRLRSSEESSATFVWWKILLMKRSLLIEENCLSELCQQVTSPTTPRSVRVPAHRKWLRMVSSLMMQRDFQWVLRNCCKSQPTGCFFSFFVCLLMWIPFPSLQKVRFMSKTTKARMITWRWQNNVRNFKRTQ